MNIRQWIRYAIAAFVMVCGAACTSDFVPADGGSGLTPDGKVRITMQLDPADFAKPVVSRGDAPIPNPNETTVDHVLILVFEGNDPDDAICVEAVWAELNANTIIAELTQRDGPVWISCVANLMEKGQFEMFIQYFDYKQFIEDKFVGNCTLGDFSSESLAELILNGTTQELGDYAFNIETFFSASFNSERIESPFLNYTTNNVEWGTWGGNALPMYASFKSEQGIYPGVQPPGGIVKLTRITAKVTVESQDEEFVPVSIMLYNTPVYGAWYRFTSIIPDLSAVENISQYYDPTQVVAGTEMALYPFEASKTNPPVLFLNAEYKGTEYTYVLPFDDADGNPMDVVRNHHYKFVIKKGDVGISGFDMEYDDPADYLHMAWRVEFAIDVTDMSAHTIVTNGNYFLGVSNEEMIVMANPGIEIESVLAVTVTTDFNYQWNLDSPHLYAEGVEIVDGANDENLELSSDGTVASTDIRINIPAGVNEGKIAIRVGGLTREVRVRRVSPYTYDGQGFSLWDSDILHVELDERGQNDWLKGFSINPGGNPEPVLTRGVAGPVYMRTKNWKGIRDASFYYTRQGGGRTKVVASMRPDFDFDMSAPNCYIVAPGETLEIPVEKAYGFWADETFVDAETPLPFENLTAELLWKDVAGTGFVTPTLIKTGEVYEYKIHVQTDAGTNRNAVVAFKSGNEIYWSWHIWVTDYNPNTNTNGTTHTYAGNAFNPGGIYYGKKIMDRNLGATWSAADGLPIGSVMSKNSPAPTIEKAAKAYGLMYQWGRKDPFPGANGTVTGSPTNGGIVTIYDRNATELTESGSNGTGVKLRSIPGGTVCNLGNAVKNPMTFFFNGNLPYDWYTTQTSKRNDNLWCEGGATPTAGSKTAFDPCPEGWRVPIGGTIATNNTWAGFSDGNPASVEKNQSDLAFDLPTDFRLHSEGGYAEQGPSNATKGRLYRVNEVNAWYPVAGLRGNEDGKISQFGISGFYWNSAISSFQTYCHSITDYRVGPAEKATRANGFSVRCVQE